MRKITKQILVFFTAMCILFIPFGPAANAQNPPVEDETSVEQMVADVLIIRPLGIVATALGLSFFTLALPFSALGGNTKEAFTKMVKEPAKFTFVRPLGDF